MPAKHSLPRRHTPGRRHRTVLGIAARIDREALGLNGIADAVRRRVIADRAAAGQDVAHELHVHDLDQARYVLAWTGQAA
ncbi:hypothetical protein O4215_20465 [Rhodococcus maanshanensis]|uniref:hypothetical protein n=1 Tax=Rhodococcus maanshanensis TaxID=183556 RepID=UPI0022B42024|nr:hypothetical protein [Rhodococcus maanshanensis]MCZ4557938.1 hypothetical protein [Rhodococcus maanshanensis]